MFDNWRCPFTFGCRYDEMGIAYHVLEHARTCQDTVNIIDVGCSTGVALNRIQKCLLTQGIKLHTVGIDASKWVESEAVANLDEFVADDVLKVKDRDETADVVICVNVTRLINRLQKYNILMQCWKFMKPTGMFVGTMKIPKGVGSKEGMFTNTPKPVCIRGIRAALVRIFPYSDVLALDKDGTRLLMDAQNP